VQVLSTIDVLILLDIYAAGEAVIANADGKTLSRAIRTRGQVDPIFVKNEDDLLPILKAIIQTNDVILTLGAGSVGQIADQLPKQLTALLNS
jgi:UDP-N-acetylmuramate--alanine ligase